MSLEQWSQHFLTVFLTLEAGVDLPVSNTDRDDAMPDELHVPTTDEEARVAISSVNSRKARGQIMSQQKC